MQYRIESPGLTARISPSHRRASMRRFERLHLRVLLVCSTGFAIVLTTWICRTSHLLN